MSSKEDFRDNSVQLIQWIRNLGALLGHGINPQLFTRDRIYNQLKMLDEIAERLPGIERQLDEWESRIISSDQAGSDAVAVFCGISSATAHQCAAVFLFCLIDRHIDWLREQNLPEDFDAWPISKVRLVNNWFASELQMVDEDVLVARMQREMVKAYEADSQPTESPLGKSVAPHGIPGRRPDPLNEKRADKANELKSAGKTMKEIATAINADPKLKNPTKQYTDKSIRSLWRCFHEEKSDKIRR